MNFGSFRSENGKIKRLSTVRAAGVLQREIEHYLVLVLSKRITYFY